MTHMERKSFVLPCGRTLGNSWGALRKAWHGFKIAHNNGDVDTMRKYASIIRKLQLEMAIELTPFDSDLLDEETIRRIENEVKMLEKAMAEEISDGTRAMTNSSGVSERNYDYDTLLTEDKKEIRPTDLPPPNEVHFSREKGCYVSGQGNTDTAADVIEFIHHVDRSIDYLPGGSDNADKLANPKPEGNGLNEENSCYHKSKPKSHSEST